MYVTVAGLYERANPVFRQYYEFGQVFFFLQGKHIQAN